MFVLEARDALRQLERVHLSSKLSRIQHLPESQEPSQGRLTCRLLLQFLVYYLIAYLVLCSVRLAQVCEAP